MPEPGALSGRAVLVTRPASQAGRLCGLIEAAGGSALRLPLQAIAPVADRDALIATLEAWRKADRWIFTSVNAVAEAARLLPPPWPPVAAVGPATAAALAMWNCRDVLQPAQGEGAAALLAEPAFAALHGQRIAVIGGERPLPLLGEALPARGADCALIAVYRRVPVAHPAAAVGNAIRSADAIVLASGEALQQLVAQTAAADRDALLASQLVVASARVLETARALGFRHVPLIPPQVTDAGFVAALARLPRQAPPP